MTNPNLLIDDCETFRLAGDCIGVVWHDAAGWHGNLHWDVEGDTDFVGPFVTITAARNAVRAAFDASGKSTLTGA